MAAGEVYQKILEHLKKDGPLNTFRLARDLNIDRSILLNLIEKLDNAGAVEVQHGAVKFLKFVTEEKKAEKPIAPQIRTENKVLKSKAFGTPEAKPLNELKEKILQLESKVAKLEQKASARPKIIKKTIVKEVPAPTPPPQQKKRKKRKTKKRKKIKKKLKRKEKKKSKKAKKRSKKFKFPKFTFMKNIKQLKKPEFAKK